MRYADLFKRLMSWWRGTPPALSPVVEEAPPEPNAPEPVQAVQAETEEPQGPPLFNYGSEYQGNKPRTWDGNQTDAAFHFKADILDQLDRYMVLIARMKRTDPNAYELYHRIGGTIIPRSALMELQPELSPRWRAGHRPSFGCMAVAISSKDIEAEKGRDSTGPRFLYFMRVEPGTVPCTVEHVEGGTIYVVTFYYDLPDDKSWKSGAKADIFLHIDDQCHIRVLRTMAVTLKRIKHKRGWPRTSEIPTGLHLELPHVVVEWYEKFKHKGFTSVDDYIAHIFSMFIEVHDRPGMLRVACTKGHLTATFTIDIERTPYFFADRNATFNQNGQKKRIFHIVRAHSRKDGRRVRIGFRGLRRFTWNGYDVNVTVPGLHHNLVEDFESAASLSEPHKDNRGYIGVARLGRTIQRHLNA
jgi:hypothetical protein